MAYEKHNWSCGETVTAELLNHMEEGIADAVELPSVTSADNGKILGVDDGEYKLVDVSERTVALTAVPIKTTGCYATYPGSTEQKLPIALFDIDTNVGDTWMSVDSSFSNPTMFSGVVKTNASVFFASETIAANLGGGCVVKVEDDTLSKFDIYFGNSKLTDLSKFKAFYIHGDALSTESKPIITLTRK